MEGEYPTFELMPLKARMLLMREFQTKDDCPWRPKEDGIGVTAMTLINWKNGTTPEIKSVEKVCTTANDILKLQQRWFSEMFFDEVPVRKFAELIGFEEDSIKQKHYTDKFILKGPHTEFVFDKKKKGEQEVLRDSFGATEGLYHIFRAENGRIIRLGMAVCAAVPVTDRRDESRFAIVADMAVPRITGGKPYLYAGNICQRHELTTWNFLQEDRARRDYAVLMTDHGDPGRQDKQRLGAMITRAQQGVTPTPVSYSIVVRRCGESDLLSPGEISQFLSEAATLKPENVDLELKRLLLRDQPASASPKQSATRGDRVAPKNQPSGRTFPRVVNGRAPGS